MPALPGGVPTAPAWCTNPQWLLTCSAGKPTTIFVALGQAGARPRVLGLSVLRAAQPSKPAKAGGGGAQASVTHRAWSHEVERLAAEAGPKLAREVRVGARYATIPKATYDRNRDRDRDRTEGCTRAHPSLPTQVSYPYPYP